MSKDSSSTSALKLCGLCNEKDSKYCCPRCEVLYCSLDCYKSDKHVNCSESFYRDCVHDEIASFQPDEKSHRNMIDILKRMRDEEPGYEGLVDDAEADSDDNDESELKDRLKDLNLDDADAVWNVLTEDERNDFEALLNEGNASSFIPQWQPWWAFQKEEKLVEDVDDDSKEEEEALKKCPLLLKVQKFSLLTSVQPSPAIKFNITNVIASYAFVIRYFNGELEPIEGTRYFLNVCANFDENTNFEDAVTALESVAQRCLQSDLIQTDEMSLDVMTEDTFSIIQGPSKKNKLYYCRAALSHLHELFIEAKTVVKLTKIDGKVTEEIKDKGVFSRKFEEDKSPHLLKLDLGKIKKCIKKIEYYLSYAECYGIEFE